MIPTFSAENLQALVASYKGDSEVLDLIFACLQSFENYHNAVYELEIKKMVKTHKATELADYQEMIQSADQNRTIYHNSVLAKVNILNRLAAQANLPLVYDGKVSEEKPYRRQVADAVFTYMESIIRKRS